MDKHHAANAGALHPLSSRTAMSLAFWAYPHDNVEKANEVLRYPKPWEHAKPGRDLPPSWQEPTYDENRRLKPGSPEGWNTQHNANGRLENQFKVSINHKTQEITFDFKGSDAWSNWFSDLANAGASEFAKIQAKAQAAYEYLSQQPEFQHFRFAATGHSLGGGMAQSFALRNNIDAYVYNSLPIARDTIAGGYFDSVGGFDAAMERYKSSGRHVHDVRTPNDIATHAYEGVMQNRYLSRHVGDGPQWLPGARVPDFLKTAMLASKVGTIPAVLLMGKDHSMTSLANTQQGLSTDPQGRYHIPEGHQDFAQIPADVRRRFALLEASPITKTMHLPSVHEVSDIDRYQIQRKDGSHQLISVNSRSGDVEIDHYSATGTQTRIELNERRGQPARIKEYDAQQRLVREEVVAMRESGHVPAPQPTQMATAPHDTALATSISRQIGPQLLATGLSATDIERLGVATVQCCRQENLQIDRVLVSKDGQRLGILPAPGAALKEVAISQLLEQPPAHATNAPPLTQVHLHERVSAATRT